MLKPLTIAALALLLAFVPAAAQEQGNGDGVGGAAETAIPPSAAVKLALRAVPGATALGVKMRNGIYVVRLKQDGTITQVGVDPATGEVFPLD